MTAPLRYAFYGRTSSDNQKKDETIETQLKAARDWSERTGLPMREHYLDDGVSSTTPFAERAHGSRLLGDARAGRFTHVLAYSFRRLGRDQLDTLQTINALSGLGVRVQSICEPVPDGGEDDVAVLMIGVLTSFGQYDWVQLRRLLNAGKEKWAGEGYWPGGPPPFGYRLAGERRKRLARNEDELRALRRIGDLYLTGDYSQHRLSDLLNADKTPTPKAMRDGNLTYRWTGSLLCTLLSNPLYTGRITWRGREVARDPSLAVFTDEEFERIRAITLSNKAYSSRNSKRDYLLRGMVKCAVEVGEGRVCGRALCGWAGGTWYAQSRQPRGGTTRTEGVNYYRCCSRFTKGGRCGAVSVNAAMLEAAVWDWCLDALADPDAHLDRVRASLQSEPDISAAVARLRDVAALEEEKRQARARALGMVVRGTMSEADAVPILEELREEADALEAERARLDRRVALARDADRILVERRALLRQLGRAAREAAEPRQRRLVLEQIARAVHVRLTERGAAPEVTVEPL